MGHKPGVAQWQSNPAKTGRDAIGSIPASRSIKIWILADIEEKIENSAFYKYSGIAPEGFVLVPVEIIEDLKDFDNWKEFKYEGIGWIDERSKDLLKK